MNKLSHRIPRPRLAQLIGKPETKGAEEHHREGAEAEAESQESGEKKNIHRVNTFLPSSVKATLGLLLTGFLGGVLP